MAYNASQVCKLPSVHVPCTPRTSAGSWHYQSLSHLQDCKERGESILEQAAAATQLQKFESRQEYIYKSLTVSMVQSRLTTLQWYHKAECKLAVLCPWYADALGFATIWMAL